MNRKQKIIISITGIVIVVLALLGLTYAYFVTQIQGNENDKSIEVSTANLRLVYGDGNGSITATNIMPGTEISSKEFTVTNEGNRESSYITVFENILYTDTKTDPVTQINSFSRQEDLKYTLTCKQYNASDVETGDCDGVTDTIFPTATTMTLIVSNKIPVGYVHKYVLTLNYNEAGVDQSDDMGKGLSAKVNIKDIKTSNPYATLSGTVENPVEEPNNTLAYNIINNAKLNKNGTSLVNVPLTKPGKETTSTHVESGEILNGTYSSSTGYCVYGDSYTFNQYNGFYNIENTDGSPLTITSNCSDLNGKYVASANSNIVNNYEGKNQVLMVKITNNTYTNFLSAINHSLGNVESILSITPDDFGTSYYFRGGVKNNYVNYSGMCWRIVRIEGDASIKLVLASPNGTCEATENLTTKSAFIGMGDYGYKNNKADYLNTENRETSMKYMLDKFLAGEEFSSKNYNNQTIKKQFSAIEQLKLKEDIWCLDDQTTKYNDVTGEPLTETELTNMTNNNHVYYAYNSGKRLGMDYTSTLKCNGDKFANKIGVLNADEIAFAGGVNNSTNSTFYLNENALDVWSSLSISTFDFNEDLRFAVDNGRLYNMNDIDGVDLPIQIRPSITLIPGVEIIPGGIGTQSNPYVINMES